MVKCSKIFRPILISKILFWCASLFMSMSRTNCYVEFKLPLRLFISGSNMKLTCEFHLLKQILFSFIFRERGREGKRERETLIGCTPQTGGLACKAVMCPDWESNW